MMTAFFARFRERLKRARRRCFVPPAAEVAFFAVTLAVAVAVLTCLWFFIEYFPFFAGQSC